MHLYLRKHTGKINGIILKGFTSAVNKYMINFIVSLYHNNQ